MRRGVAVTRRRAAVTLVLACAALTGPGGRAFALATAAGNAGATAATSNAGATAAGGVQTVAAASLSPLDFPAAPVATRALRAHLWLGPQHLEGVLRGGLRMRVSVNGPAAAIVTLSVARATAVHAGLRAAGRGPVTLGRGTVGGLRDGSNPLRVRLPRVISRRLASLRALRIRVRMLVVGAGQRRLLTGAALCS